MNYFTHGAEIVRPKEYGPDKTFPGGPSAGQRLEGDVLRLSGVTTVIWLEGINDFSKSGNAAVVDVVAGMREGVARMRAGIPGIRVVGGTVVSALCSTIASGAHGFPEQDAKRKALNDFIRSSGVFDGVADFDAATLDPLTSGIKPEFVPESTMGGAGDRLHPNRVGYLAMGMSIDLALVAPSLAGRSFQGSKNSLGTLTEGWGIFQNRIAGGIDLIRNTMLSFPATYELFPSYARSCRLGDRRTHEFLNIYDPAVWNARGWLPPAYRDGEPRAAAFRSNLGRAEIEKSPEAPDFLTTGHSARVRRG